jgi:hypothetical protein
VNEDEDRFEYIYSIGTGAQEKDAETLEFIVQSKAVQTNCQPKLLNQALKWMNHQTTTIEDIFPEKSKAKVFTTLDSSNWFK